MSVQAATLADTVLGAALAYEAAGLSVIPVSGKQAAVPWAKYQNNRAPAGMIHNWDYRGLLQGVAVVCGKVSGNLAVIDLDGDDACAEFAAVFPHRMDTLTVKSGSGHGLHLYYFTEVWTPTTRTKGFEVRSNGCYVVAPPSVHPVSLAWYKPVTHIEPRRVRDLGDVLAWIIAKIQTKTAAQRQDEQRQALLKFYPNAKIRHPRNYACAALSMECDAVRLAGVGSRNSALYAAALKMGNFIALQILSQSEVEDALLRAAGMLSSDDGEIATYRTIQSGIMMGIRRNARA